MAIKKDFTSWCVFALGLLLIAYGFLKWQRNSLTGQGDMQLYYSVSSQLFAGKIPYRDFKVEYPPLALLPMVIPNILAFETELGFRRYVFLYMLEMLLLAGGFAVVLLKMSAFWPNRLTAWQLLLVYLLLVFLCRDLVLWRYDLFPAFLTLLTTLAVLRNRPLIAGFWLGLAIMAKLYPVILFPVFAMYYLTEKQVRASVLLTIGTGFALLIVGIPALILSDNQVFSFLTYHQLRGLQIESTASGFLLLIHLPDLKSVSVVFNFGAFHVMAPGAEFILKALTGLFLLGICGTLAVFGLRFRREYKQFGTIPSPRLLASLLAVMLVFISINKVFSPQYLIWLLPFVFFLPFRQLALVGAVFLLTNLVYPVFYPALIDLKPLAIVLLNVRNLLVVLLLGQLVVNRVGIEENCAESGANHKKVDGAFPRRLESGKLKN
ncbi:glycosyltransferase 87 family protein [Larkinella rosea]|uniref:DUF2029 domain-containing protein n=1 Tax=Larkinella rosea TaxID=2025312 RepID=A0A3P1BV39_9BACT|nr:glycosyltransferase 87 family protein [Larkinella rosea]RRB04872.1 DUF2029 domain-containing protein [Larkinella rosea]